jgi:hypothetical protein
VLDREVLIAERAPFPAGLFEKLARPARQPRALASVAVRQLRHRFFEPVAQREHGHANAFQYGEHRRTVLAEQSQQKMVGCYLRVVAPAGVGRRGGKSLLGFLCPTIGVNRQCTRLL